MCDGVQGSQCWPWRRLRDELLQCSGRLKPIRLPETCPACAKPEVTNEKKIWSMEMDGASDSSDSTATLHNTTLAFFLTT